MKISPYLTFDGTARAAATRYAEIFGVKIEMMMSFGEMPPQDWVTDANRDRIAHARVDIGTDQLMISDTAGLEPFGGHSGHAINIVLEDFDHARALFEALADGGETTMDFQKTFWAKGFGICRDKFGVSWMVNCADPDAPDPA